MRKFILVSLLALVAPVQGMATFQTMQQPSFREDLIPWPWGAEADFPWRLIDGFWMAPDNVDGMKFFVFRSSFVRGQPVLFIDRVDPLACSISGRGYAVPVGRVLRGRIDFVPTTNLKPRLFELRSFPENSVRGDQLPPALEGHRLVLSMAAPDGTKAWHLALRRVSTSTLNWCMRTRN